MEIANPMYDEVFKYLMEDNDIAKLIISTIIGEEILELDFRPQEDVFETETRFLTVYRLDFSAKIKISEKESRLVIIEVQKAKFPTDIMRFRRYVGKQYQDGENVYIIKEGKKEIKKAMPIVSIYFLGYKLERIKAPAIRIARHLYDAYTGEEIEEQEEFIESLTHDSYVVQVPYLKEGHRIEIEELLSIFDQNKMTSDRKVLEINEKAYPEKFRKLIRRLQRARSDAEVRRKMDVEDDIIEEFQNLEREVAEAKEEIEEKNRIIAEDKKVLEDKDRIIAEDKKVLEDKDRIIAEDKKVLEDKDRIIAEDKKALEDKDRIIAEDKKALEDKDKIIEELKRKLGAS